MVMIIKSAIFSGSYPGIHKMPKAKYNEFAFIGRSNVGKSSLINMLLDRRGLAKTSSTPGKTQMVNQFIINESWCIIDLPGYGYAKLSKKHRNSLSQMIQNYLTKRESLINTFILIDGRHELQELDMNFLKWTGENQLPFSIVFTKCDKLKPSQLNKNILHFKSKLSQLWDPLPPIFLSSSSKKTGKKEVLSYINLINTQ